MRCEGEKEKRKKGQRKAKKKFRRGGAMAKKNLAVVLTPGFRGTVGRIPLPRQEKFLLF